MRLLLVADTYPPARISGALQMRDLAIALARQGHRPLVLVPTSEGAPDIGLEEHDGVQVLRARAPRTKDMSYLRRTLAEFVLPWYLLRGLQRSELRSEQWDGVIWYSPSIFLGQLVRRLKRAHGCPGFLIVRDLFPDWAVDAGLIRRRGLPYRLLKAVERHQYRQADVIGVQTPSNMALVARDAPDAARIEVLHNWLAPCGASQQDCHPSLQKLKGRINFVYAGNMGVAQDLDAFVSLARSMQEYSDIGFVFVGRGSETARLKRAATRLSNLDVIDEIDPADLTAMLAKCHIGIIALHPGHGTHNIPGKLLTYLHAGLPVLARVNSNNDLVNFIEREAVGLVVAGDDAALLHVHARRLAADANLRECMGARGRDLGQRLFSPNAAALQVVEALRAAALKYVADGSEVHP